MGKLNLGPAFLVVAAGGVQFWMLWLLSGFSHQPSMVHVSVGTVLFFLLATLAAGYPRGETRRNLVLLAILALISGWVLHLDAVVNYPRRYYSSSAEGFGSGIVWYVLLLGAPSWLVSLVVTIGSVDSRSSLSEFVVEVCKLAWLKVGCIFLLAGLQMRFLLMLGEMRAPTSILPLSLIIAGFFLTSLVKTLWPRTAGIEVLWRSLTWAVGLVLLSGLYVEADPWLPGAWTLATDLFAFLTPVWLLRLWLGAEPSPTYRAAPSPPSRSLSNEMNDSMKRF